MSDTMIDDAVKIAAGAGGFGVAFGTTLAFFRWLINWLTGRHDHREARLDKRWSEFMDAQDKRIHEQDERIEKQGQRMDSLEKEVETCHEERRNLQAILARMEGFATGRGEARGAEQIAQSLDNMIKNKEVDR